MSRGISNYKCVCGGNITEEWDALDIIVTCDKDGCDMPYPKELWEEINKDIQNGTKHIYKGTVYFECDTCFYVQVAENNGKPIYNSHESEDSAKKWIDDSSVQVIL